MAIRRAIIIKRVATPLAHLKVKAPVKNKNLSIKNLKLNKKISAIGFEPVPCK